MPCVAVRCNRGKGRKHRGHGFRADTMYTHLPPTQPESHKSDSSRPTSSGAVARCMVDQTPTPRQRFHRPRVSPTRGVWQRSCPALLRGVRQRSCPALLRGVPMRKYQCPSRHPRLAEQENIAHLSRKTNEKSSQTSYRTQYHRIGTRCLMYKNFGKKDLCVHVVSCHEIYSTIVDVLLQRTIVTCLFDIHINSQ